MPNQTADRGNAQLLLSRAFIQRLLGHRERAANLCHEALRFAGYTETQAKAHAMLSALEFSGPDYFRILARIHEHLRPATYLEIGVDEGGSLEIVRPETLTLGIDPNNYYLQAHQGWHYIQTGDYERARMWFKRSMDTLPWGNYIALNYLQIVDRKLKENPTKKP